MIFSPAIPIPAREHLDLIDAYTHGVTRARLHYRWHPLSIHGCHKRDCPICREKRVRKGARP